MNLHHIGIAVTDMEKTAELFRAFGYVAEETKTDLLQNVSVKFLRHMAGPLLELISDRGGR